MTGEQEQQLQVMLSKWLRTMPLSDAVYSALREAISTNILPPSARVSGAALAEALGVSRTPMRDALRRLESERLVVSVPGTGVMIAEITMQDIEEIYALRVALEGCAASRAAHYRTPADLLLLESLHEAFGEAAQRGDAPTLARLNAQFHNALCDAAKSRRLSEFLTLLQESVRRLGPTTLALPDRVAESLREHGDLLAAIRAGDATQAETVARQHMEKARDRRLQQHRLRQTAS